MIGPDLSIPPAVSLRRDVARWLQNRAVASRAVVEHGQSRALRSETDQRMVAWHEAEAVEAERLAAKLEGAS